MEKRPNFIVIMTDDQGYGDLSCMGAEDFSTPYIDALAASGARFTNWYSASPVCSPSRASLLTGRYPGNAGVRAILAGGRKTSGLLPEVPTLSSELKKLGYHTAMFGKWHLGVTEECRPQHHGFQEWSGFLAGCIDYYSHIFYWGMCGDTNPVHDLWKNGEEFYDNGKYFTEYVTENAVDYIGRAAETEKPFFLYVAYNAPHYPMHAPKKYTDRFRHLPWDRQIMAAMLSAVDDGVGEIRAELERRGLLNNTVIFYQSDNGPSREARNWLDGRDDPYYGGTAGKLKGHKYSLYEGGIRVPGILSWPAEIPEGRVIDEYAGAVDIFPTFVRLAGGDEKSYAVDGKDIFGVAANGDKTPHDAPYWEMGKQTAVRKGKWKLVLNGQLEEGAPEEDDVHLSDLEADMGERVNLKNEYPEIVSELKASAESWRGKIEEKWAKTHNQSRC